MVQYLATRLIAYVGVILFGITFIFFLPRFLPSDPVEAMLSKIMSQGSTWRQRRSRRCARR
jgi:peptide/nickel transport system permease protein